MSNSPESWLAYDDIGRGPIRPEYVAEVFIKNSANIPRNETYGKFEKLLETPAGKSMSHKQKEFLETSSSYEFRAEFFPDKPIDYVRISLYAVSQEDAKKMVQAFIELVNKRVNELRNEYKQEIHENEQGFIQAQKDLPEKNSELKEVEQEYKELKEKIHPLSSDTEAVDLASKSIIEMNKTLNDLEIELAGVNERLKTIEKYRNEPVPKRSEVAAKLDVMYVELIVELSGLEAKKSMTGKINSMEQRFMSLFSQQNDLINCIKGLDSTIKKYPKNIEQWTNDFKSNPNMQPLEVYQNKVTIYPVANQ
jgi:predicted  nucleic acid-binding Zn-ribbon protein